MVNTNKDEIIKLCAAINKKEGDGSVFMIDSKNANLKINRWSTGIEDLDRIIGGGMPEGRIIELYGAYSSGKTSLAYHLLARHNLCLNIPIEGTMDIERAKMFGNRKGQMLVYRARYGEDALNKTIKFAKAGISLIVIDSVPSLVPRDNVEKVHKAADKDTKEEPKIGATATLLNTYLPVIEDIIENTGTTVIFINQVRDTMNAMLFGEKVHSPGGKKLEHADSLKILMARRAWIEIPNKRDYSTEANEKIGLIIKMKVQKSKVCPPMGECEVPMFFDRGFVSFNDVQEIRKEIMQSRNEEFGKRGRLHEEG